MKNNMNRFHMTSSDRSYIARNMRAIQRENAFYNDLHNSSHSSKDRPKDPLIIALLKIAGYMLIQLFQIAGYVIFCVIAFKYIIPFAFDFFFNTLGELLGNIF